MTSVTITNNNQIILKIQILVYFFNPIGSLEAHKVLVKPLMLTLYDRSETLDVFVIKIRRNLSLT